MHKILLADDDTKILDTLEKHLKRMGYSDVDRVCSGDEAVHRLKRNEYDVIISDYQMDGGNGLSVLEHNIHDSPFILITGCLNNKLSTTFINNDAFRILEKPFQLGEFQKAVEDAIAKKDKTRDDQKNILIGKRTGHIVHDINNQLQIIDMSSAIGEKKTENEDQKSHFKRIKRAVSNVSGIVQSYKSLHQSELSYSEINLKELLEEIYETYHSGLKNKYKIDLQVSIPSDDIIVRGDRLALMQVFGNLIINAKDAIAQEENKWIKLTYDLLYNGKIELYLSDCGYIEDSKRDTIFNEGFTTKGNDGTGKGLFYCKQILNLHMGDIHVKDADNTCFKITLPLGN